MDPSGQWENQNGSVLSIGPVENGTFEGTFVSSKGRARAHRCYPVRGTVNGELLAFAVDFQLKLGGLGSAGSADNLQ